MVKIIVFGSLLIDFANLRGQSNNISLNLKFNGHTNYRVFEGDTFRYTKAVYYFSSDRDTQIYLNEDAFHIDIPENIKLKKTVFSKEYLMRNLHLLQKSQVIIENKSGKFRMYKSLYGSSIKPKFSLNITRELSMPEIIRLKAGKLQSFYFYTYPHFLKVKNSDKIVRIHYAYRNSPEEEIVIISSGWLNLNETE